MCLLACLVGAPGLSAAAAVRGTVIDASGGAIAGAGVRLQSDGRTLAETRTSDTGDFTLTPPASWPAEQPLTVFAAAEGFSPASRSGTPAALADRGLTITLEVAPYRLAVEVRAVAPPNESTLDMSGVRESAAKDVGEALTSLDGVWKIRKAGIANDVVIRGFQQNNLTVLVDGSRTYGACPSHMDPPAQHVDFAEVDRVEVSKGAFDVANQGSLGAMVNIVTKSPGMGFSLKPSLSAGSFGYYNPSLTASYGNRIARVLGGYSYRMSDPYLDGSGRAFTDYAPYSANGKGQHSFDIHTGWIETEVSLTDRQQISLGYSRQQAGLILYPYLMMDSDYDHADRGTFKYAARDLAAGLRNLRVEGYFTQVRHFMSDSQRTSAMMGNWMMASDAATRVIGGRVEGDWGDGLTLGVESYHRNWNMLGYMRMGGATAANPSIPDVNTQTAGAFATYRRSLAERVKLSAGARFDHAGMRVDSAQASTNLYYQFHNTRRVGNQDNYASGNVRLSFALPGAGDVFAGVGTTGRIPDAEERYIARGMGAGAFVGNPLLPVTRNTEVSAGWSLNRSRFYVRPELFYSVLNNFILVNNQPQLNAMGTGGGSMAIAPTARSYANVDARIYGGETAYGITLSRDLSLNGGASYTRGTATPQPGINVRSGNLPEMPPLRGWSALRYARRWAFAEFGAIAVNRQSLVSADLKEVPTAGYGLLNLKLGFTRGGLSGSFTIENLLNRFYYEHLSYYRDPFAAGVKVPEPGRNIFAQLRYSY
ncbi:MAG: TonB-dependent receptor [Acidobacteria bacterium]|nr:TonB-dependent receptor [Acidobacteriota bacterium]